MSRVPSSTEPRFDGVYEWLAQREEEACRTGSPILWDPRKTTGGGSLDRLEAFQRGEPVDIYIGALPKWARPEARADGWIRDLPPTGGRPCQWIDPCGYARVSPDGSVEFRHDTALWIAENGL